MLYLNLNNYQPNFGANLKSPKLKLSQKDFFIKIRGYGKNIIWAEKNKEVTDTAVNMLRKNTSAENVLKYIVAGILDANVYTLDLDKRRSTGILRTQRKDWRFSDYDRYISTAYESGRYSGYKDRLDFVYKNPLKKINPNLAMSRPNKFQDIDHGVPELINFSLDYIFNLFKEKYSKFLKKDVKTKDLNEIIDVVAEMRWVLAHATPWLRGSDAISNVLMRAMFKAVGVKAYPPAKNISFDMEAFCRNLDDYKANFNTFFEKPLEVVE